MTESTTVSPLTTEQLAGTDSTSTAVQPAGSSAQPAAPTADAPHADGGTANDVALQGQSSRPVNDTAVQAAPLLDNNGDFVARWTAIQTGFVDEPRMAVEQADTLVAEVIRELARVFAEERGRLEGAWSRGSDVSTEDLRQALQRYRDFFHVLLRS